MKTKTNTYSYDLRHFNFCLSGEVNSESESQTGNSGSEDNSQQASVDKDTGKNNTTAFVNGPSTPNSDRVPTPSKEVSIFLCYIIAHATISRILMTNHCTIYQFHFISVYLNESQSKIVNQYFEINFHHLKSKVIEKVLHI